MNTKKMQALLLLKSRREGGASPRMSEKRPRLWTQALQQALGVGGWKTEVGGMGGWGMGIGRGRKPVGLQYQ